MTLAHRTDSAADFEELATTLESTGAYRVLRRIEPRRFTGAPQGVATRKAVFLDVETTGLDSGADEVIEIALLPFTYGLDGSVWGVHPPYQSFREPSKPIPAEITRLTGITDEMVAGAQPDLDAIERLLGDVSLVIAHNAGFDRSFAEKLHPLFQAIPWACSMAEIDWAGEGYQGTKLAYLAMESGLFYDGHRALHDCAAGIELLSRDLPKAGTTAMAALLQKARRATCRIWAEHSPYDLKAQLKARGYRWSDGSSGMPRSWYVDVDETACDDELAWLRAEIYQRDVELQVRRMTARERYSDRL